MPLGDSITAGLTVIQGVHTFEGGYRRKLETLLEQQMGPQRPGRLGFDFVGSQTDPDTAVTRRKHHEGHSGWKIEDLDGQVEYWVPAANPDIVLLLAGANDILQQHDLETAPDRFIALIDHIQNVAPQAWILASSILPMYDPKMDAQVQDYNSAIGELVLARQHKGEKIRWVDMNGTSGLTADELPDGLHPKASGYDKMADTWFSALLDFQLFTDDFIPDSAILSSLSMQ
jgi:hypothetical protein